MPSVLHFTNGDSAAGVMRAGGIKGEIIPWRDVLHEGPVPADQDLRELSRTRARFIAAEGLGNFERVLAEFEERDNFLRRYTDYDEVVLWFEWDLYDQLQLIQILDFLSQDSEGDRAETNTRLTIVSFAGYLGNLDPAQFSGLFERRVDVTSGMLESAKTAWQAFRSRDPRDIQSVAQRESDGLEFLQHSLWRHLEEFPSTRNGLSRSESQILEAIAQRPLAFHELFRRVAHREERVFCGDAVIATYIERMSDTTTPLVAYTSGEHISAPRTEDDSRAFRNAEMALTSAGRDVLRCDSDWIESGGSDRWLGGVHLEGEATAWRWNPDARRVEVSNGIESE